jgi:SAM-dependent methyltransferase
VAKPPSDIGSYYDRFWSGADPSALEAHDYHAFQADIDRYVDRVLGDLRGSRVLEIGPGLGHDTQRLAEKGARVVSIDLSEVSLRQVGERCGEAGLGEAVHLALMNGEKLAVADGSFDVTFVRNTLVHCDWRAVAGECARVLRPGGRAIFVEPLRDNPAVAVYRRTLSHCQSSNPTYVSWGDLKAIGESFVRGDVRPFYLVSVVALATRHSPIDPLVRPPLKVIDTALLKLGFLRPFAWYGVAIFER